MQQKKRHRLGVIGLGMRLSMFLRAAHADGWNFEIVGHVDPAPVGLPLLAERGIDVGASFADVPALLAAGTYDLVMIGSPNHLHLEHLTAALRRSGPTFVEKPVVRTEAESMTLARLLADRDTSDLYVGLVARSAPIICEAIARIDAGAVGEIVSIDATEHLPPAHGAYLARNWRRRQEFSGSYMLDKVCHDFDILGRLVGARASRVASFGGRRIFRPDRPDIARDEGPAILRQLSGWNAAKDDRGADMDVTDHQVAIVEYANGVQLSFHTNTCASASERRWNIIGTEGTMTLDLVANTFTVVPLDPSQTIERLTWRGPPGDSHGGADQAMARDLVAALDGRAPFPVSVRDSLVAGLTVMAIDRAMADGSVVDCAPLWRELEAADAIGVAA